MLKRSKRLAYDRSLRHVDTDGRLHIEMTPISKANVCPYYGREIPGSEILGLDPDKLYQLLRDEKELEKAAETSDNIQVLEEHEGVSADAPKQWLVVGTTGTDGVFDYPYLKNSMAIWVKSAIDAIRDNRKRQLSASYHYKPDMTPGEFLGQQYDGVMRKIKFNHVALVKAGRAGNDVLVADAMPLSLQHHFGVTRMSVKAQVARGALAVYLRPRLAQDAKIDLSKILLGTTSLNWGEAKPLIIQRLTKATKGKLAQDANLEDMHGLLDSLDKEGEDEEEDEAWDETPEEMEARHKKEKEARDKKARDSETEEDRAEREKKEARDKKARDKAARDKAAKDKAARDAEGEEEKEKREKKEAEDRAAKDAEEKEEKDKEEREKEKAEDKKAMDAAIKAAVSQTQKEMRQAATALREAEQLVKPVCGELLAQDSAEDVYRYLFKQQGIEIDGVDPSAYKAMAKMAVDRALNKPKPSPLLAHDSAASADFAKRFPDASRIRVV